MPCYLCGGADIIQRAGGVRGHPEIKVMQCRDCSLVFLDQQCTDDDYYARNQMLGPDFFPRPGDRPALSPSSSQPSGVSGVCRLQDALSSCSQSSLAATCWILAAGTGSFLRQHSRWLAA